MRKYFGALVFGMTALYGMVDRAAAAEIGMILLPDAKSVKWVQAPPTLPISTQINMVAGNPQFSGPSPCA